MKASDFDLLVIGGGSAGVRAARIAAGYGARVALAEESRVGGTCVIRGCVPKKLMVYASRFAEEFEDSAGFGWTLPGEPRFDWAALIANKDREIDRLNAAYIRTLENAGVTLFHSRAELEHPHRIRLVGEDRVVTADKVLIAAGAVPHLDRDLPGVEHVLTSNEMFHLEKLPERIAIAGGGFIAVEFAGLLRGLGAETTLVYRGAEILRGFDDDCRRMLHEAMVKRGIAVHCGDAFTRIEKTEAGLVGHTREGLRIEADQILYAIGRRPHTDGLGLKAAGVATDERGAIIVDKYSQTSCESIYAVGDVTDRVNLTPVAIREGHAFADTVFGGRKTAADHVNVPRVVFSHPEVAGVGLTEEEAKARHDAVDIYRSTFRPLKHTLSGRDERMMVKLVVDGDSDRVLGCHLFGPDSAELIQLLALAVKMNATKADFDATVAVHPTAAEELVTLSKPSERWRRTDAAEA